MPGIMLLKIFMMVVQNLQVGTVGGPVFGNWEDWPEGESCRVEKGETPASRRRKASMVAG